MPLVTSGVEHGNLRELALARMKDLGLEARDVRTREVGIQEIHNKIRPENVSYRVCLQKQSLVEQRNTTGSDEAVWEEKKYNRPGYLRQVELIRRDYTANGSWETFISYEDPDKDILIGLLRLRQCSANTFRAELKREERTSVVRELHVYGSVVPVSAKNPRNFQHQGYGTLLMEEAERIAQYEHRSTKISVISGVGTRNYYRKLGYELDGVFMSKALVGNVAASA